MTFRPRRPRLQDLPDVSIGTLTTDDLLTFNDVSGKWTNAPLGASRLGSMGIIPRSGTWAIPGHFTQTGAGTGFRKNALYVVPMWLAGRGTIERLLIQVTTAAAGVSFLPAIYADDGLYYPSSLVAALPAIDMSTTGIKASVPPGGVFLKRGLYWVGGLATGGTTNPSIIPATSPSGELGHILVGTNAFTSRSVDYDIGSGNAQTGTIDGSFTTSDIYGFVAFGRSSIPDPFPAYTGVVNNPAVNDVGTFIGTYPLTPIKWA